MPDAVKTVTELKYAWTSYVYFICDCIELRITTFNKETTTVTILPSLIITTHSHATCGVPMKRCGTETGLTGWPSRCWSPLSFIIGGGGCYACNYPGHSDTDANVRRSRTNNKYVLWKRICPMHAVSDSIIQTRVYHEWRDSTVA